MPGRLALLCPGQGAQHRAMFDLARTDSQTQLRLDAWIGNAGLARALDDLLADDGLLFSNRVAQPLVVAATLANWEALKDGLPEPAILAGYSIGELAAYAVAGALTPLDAVALAAARARLMDTCLKTTPRQALVAVSNLGSRAAGEQLRRHGFHVAIQTGDDSLIAGGPAAQLAPLRDALLLQGTRTNVLPVEVASHTPFMQCAVAPFAAELLGRAFIDPRIPVLSGITAETICRADHAIAHLSRQIAQTIIWKDCMDALAETGVTAALELGPGAGLARMLRARHPAIECRSVTDFRSLEGVARWAARLVE